MQMTRRYTKAVPIYQVVNSDNDYVGTSAILDFKGEIKATISPVSDKLNAELYGERISAMYRMVTLHKLTDGMVCLVEGILYRVVSVMKYSTHNVSIIERTDQWTLP